MATATARRRRTIEHLVATDYARDRFARAAFEIVADGLDLGPIAVRTAADRVWVREAISGPIQEAAKRALDRLVDELEVAFDGGPSELVARILSAGSEEPDADGPFGARDDGWSWRTAGGPIATREPEPAADLEPLVAVFR
jgi:hypothetical protein